MNILKKEEEKPLPSDNPKKHKLYYENKSSFFS